MSASSVISLLAQADGTEETVKDLLGVVQNWMEYVGTIAFAISGALLAMSKRMDLAGIVVLGAIVSVGGGTLRDLLVQQEVFWIEDPTFVLVGAGTALATVLLRRGQLIEAIQRHHLVQIFDAAGLALFVVTGTNVALAAGASNAAAAIIGIISGVAGGVMRDILAGEIPDVLTGGELYATAALAGAVLYLLLLELSVSPLAVFWIPVVAIFIIRLLAVRYQVALPSFGPTHHNSDR
jgi:uncharacterized membrane protein YeiH